MPACRRKAAGRRIGNGVKIPDRTAAVMRSGAQTPLEESEKAARRDDAQSEDLPVKRVSILRPKDRYVPDACAAVGVSHGRRMQCSVFAGRIGFGPYVPFFCICFPEDVLFSGSSAHWSPSAPKPAGTRRQRECGSRPPAGSAVPDGRRLRPSPWAAGYGFGVAGNRV